MGSSTVTILLLCGLFQLAIGDKDLPEGGEGKEIGGGVHVEESRMCIVRVNCRC